MHFLLLTLTGVKIAQLISTDIKRNPGRSQSAREAQLIEGAQHLDSKVSRIPSRTIKIYTGGACVRGCSA